MRTVQIQEFSLETAAEYPGPVACDEARLEEVAKALCREPITGNNINPREVVLTKQNELFSYVLYIPVFNGAGSITVNAQRITIAFKQGRNKANLDLMVDYTINALSLARIHTTKRTCFSLTAHASFDPASDYTEHMKRFTELAPNIVSGGYVLVSALPEVEGELRYTSEKSLAYENAIFLAANASTSKEASKELFTLMSNQLEITAKLDGISFRIKP
jgi:hypothetical protein